MKKFFFLVLVSAFTVVSISAQNNLNNFLGSWKLIQVEGKKSSDIPSINLIVSHVGNKFHVEKLTKDNKSNNIFRDFEVYNDDSSVSSANNRGAVLRGEINYLNPNKLIVSKSAERTTSYNAEQLVRSKNITKEYWTISKDNKFLTVISRTRVENFNDDPLSLIPQNADRNSLSNVKMTFEKQ